MALDHVENPATVLARLGPSAITAVMIGLIWRCHGSRVEHFSSLCQVGLRAEVPNIEPFISPPALFRLVQREMGDKTLA